MTSPLDTTSPIPEISTIKDPIPEISTIKDSIPEISTIKDSIPDNYLSTPIVVMPVLIMLAGIFYGITFAFNSSQIRFILYCGSVWSICLAFIYYVQRPTQTLLSSSSAE
jgi:hypothetical protein